MGVLKNVRHERFAQAVARGLPLAEAYAEAGYRPHRSSACRLLTNARVAARVEELKREAAERNKVTVDTLLAELDHNRKTALDLGQPAAANGATLGKARLLGFLNPKVTVQNDEENPLAPLIAIVRSIDRSALPVATSRPRNPEIGGREATPSRQSAGGGTGATWRR